jgi:hypothetical protein
MRRPSPNDIMDTSVATERDVEMSMDYESNVTRKLTYDELIQLELRGKFLAIERYDSILWRIRSGYVAILYGTLTIVGGASGLIATPDPDNNRMLLVLLLLIWGFSLCGFVVDFYFLRAKARVVNDTNELQDLALDIVLGKTSVEAEYDKLRELLHISGETTKKVPWPQLRNAWASVVWIYLASPLLGATIVYVLWSR